MNVYHENRIKIKILDSVNNTELLNNSYEFVFITKNKPLSKNDLSKIENSILNEEIKENKGFVFYKGTDPYKQVIKNQEKLSLNKEIENLTLCVKFQHTISGLSKQTISKGLEDLLLKNIVYFVNIDYSKNKREIEFVKNFESLIDIQ